MSHFAALSRFTSRHGPDCMHSALNWSNISLLHVKQCAQLSVYRRFCDIDFSRSVLASDTKSASRVVGMHAKRTW